MIGHHVQTRLDGRVSGEDRARVEASIEATLNACHGQGVSEAAVRVWRSVGKVHTQDGSNGQCAVLIVRDGQAVTLFWRRVSQAHTPEAHRVERVLCVKGTCSRAEHASHR